MLDGNNHDRKRGRLFEFLFNVSDRICAIGFDLFLEGYYRAKDQLLNLQEEIRKAKPADLVTRSVVKANLCDLHSSGRADCKKIEVFDSTKWARPPIICRGCVRN